MKFLLLFLFTGSVYAQNIPITGPFSGLNDTDSSITIGTDEAQDTLNVEVAQDGLALNKRKGYIKYADLPISSGPVYGAMSFKAVNGDNIKIFAHDKYISVSKNGDAFSTLISSATLGAKWSFCETGGTMYSFNDKHQQPWSYNGSTITYYPNMPYASMCSMTVDRMLLAGTTDFPNRLYFSKSGAVTDFTVDIEPEDPGFEDIGLQGDKITALFTSQAEWLIFKTNSFISYQGTNQYDLVASVISEKIGMIDPHAIVQHEGIVYFKSSSGKIYGYASGTLTELSKKISGIVSNISRETVSQKEYSSQADFASGTQVNMDSATISGSVQPYAYGFTDTTDSDFNKGNITNSSITVSNDEITINNFSPGTFPGIGAEYGTGWTSASTLVTTTVSPTYGSKKWKLSVPHSDIPSPHSVCWAVGTYPGDNYTLDLYRGFPSLGETITLNSSAHFGEALGIRISRSESGVCSGNDGYARANIPFTGGVTQFVITWDVNYIYFDFLESIPTVTSATYISSVSTVSSPAPHYGYFTEISSLPTINSYTPTISRQVRYSSATNGTFSDWETVTNNSLISDTTNTYYQYKIDMVNTGSYLKPKIYSAGLTFKSTGYWQSPEMYTGEISNWGLFSADTTLDSASTMTYTMFTSTYSGGTSVATGSTIIPGSLITASTGSYVSVKAANSFTTATETVKLNGFSFSWVFAPDKLANAFEYKGDIYFGVPYNYSLSNNRLLKFDITRGAWNIFDMAVNSPLSIDGYLYFGSPIGGYVYQYPFGNSDDGVAINSYWKSKNFIGTNPYVEKQFQKISLIAGSDSGSDLDITYTMDTTTSTTYTIDLTSSTAGFVRNNRNLPIGETGTFFNLKIGNNAVNEPWSFYGASIDYIDDPWKVIPED